MTLGWMEFGENRAYLLIAIARRKENENLDSEIVFREVVKDERDTDRKMCKLRALTDGYGDHTWRIYATINARDVSDAYWTFNQKTDNWIRERERVPGTPRSRQLKRLDNHWYSSLQKDENASDSYFIFDLDSRDTKKLDKLSMAIIEHVDGFKMIRETPNGWHIVTEPFNYTELETDVDYELKTDGLLHIEQRKA